MFLQLLSPTCIIIMTVIQVQHFHRRLIVSIQSSNLGTSSEEEHVPPPPETPPKKIRKRIYKVIAEIIVNCIQFVYLATTKILKRNKSTLWNLLEYHWIKVVYISAFVSSVNDVSNLFDYYYSNKNKISLSVIVNRFLLCIYLL